MLPDTSATIHSLPDELLLEILRNIAPYELLHTTRFANRRVQSCVHDIIRKEILPGLDIRLNVYVRAHESDGEQVASSTVELTFGARETSAGSSIAAYTITKADPPLAQPMAIEAWKAAQTYGADGMLLRACLPGRSAVFIRGREWQRFSAWAARDDPTLLLDWKKLMLKYLGVVEKLDNASRLEPQAPIHQR